MRCLDAAREDMAVTVVMNDDEERRYMWRTIRCGAH